MYINIVFCVKHGGTSGVSALRIKNSSAGVFTWRGPLGVMSKNPSARIFVSSTFQDMVEDRDELMTHVWPELRRFCRERGVELVEVDLRWGIPEQLSKRSETLKLCLDEIRTCRPFFIGLLGERYGWVPGGEAYSPDLEEEQSWLKGVRGRSITELEIIHGVLNDPSMAKRAFFYFRDPAYALGRPEMAAENNQTAAKQQALKACIREASRTSSIVLRDNYPNPRRLASLVLGDLKEAIKEEFHVEFAADVLDRQMGAHEIYAAMHRRAYVELQGYYAALDHHANSSSAPLLLQGPVGSGKSALLANWVDHWRRLHPRDFIFQHYVGGAADSTDPCRMMLRLMAEIKRWANEPGELPKSIDEVPAALSVWLMMAGLHALRIGARFIVVIDSLDRLDDEGGLRSLGWLQDNVLVGMVRLVFSTLPGEVPRMAERRDWSLFSLQSLGLDARRQMISTYLRLFGKRLDEPVAARLAAAPAAATPLYLKVLLDELRVTGTFNNLDARITGYLSAPEVSAMLHKVLLRWKRDYERECPGLVGDVLSLIWASRRGLTEAELLQLLRPANSSQLPQAIWSPLRAAMEEHLLDRGGILNFSNTYLRAAVESVFISTSGMVPKLRQRLAAYFETLPVDSRTCDELPWLLQQAGERDRLRACLLNIDCFHFVNHRDENELIRYWVWLGEERGMGQLYLHSLRQLRNNEGDGDRVTYAMLAVGSFLIGAGLVLEAEEVTRLALSDATRSRRAHSLEYLTALDNLGLLLSETGRYVEAEPLLRCALENRINLQGHDHPDTIKTAVSVAGLLANTNHNKQAEELLRLALKLTEQRQGEGSVQVSIILNNLAQVLQDKDQPAEAERLTRRALQIARQAYGNLHPTVAIYLNNLAQILREMHRTEEALPWMEQALAMDEQLFGVRNPRVAIRLNNLAIAQAELGQIAVAEAHFRKALAIDEQCYGEDHPMLERRNTALGVFLLQQGRGGQAEPYLRKSVHSAEARCGTRNPELIELLKSFSNALALMGDSRAADQQIDRVADILLNYESFDDDKWQDVRRAMAHWTMRMHQAGLGAAEIKSALKQKLRTDLSGDRQLSKRGQDIAQSNGPVSTAQMLQEAEQAMAMRQWERALTLFRQLQPFYERGSDRKALLSCLLFQAGILNEHLGRYRESLAITEKAFLLAREVSPETANDLWKLIVRLKQMQNDE